MILWITGISGAGKTTLGKHFFKILKIKKKQSLYLDGDSVRKIFNNDLGFSLKDRNLNAERIINLVSFLSNQGLNIVVAANLTSLKYRLWCRKNLKHYVEVYISAELKNLLRRDYKNLYKRSLKGEIKNVVGVDIKFSDPKTSDIYLSNNTTKIKFLQNVNIIQNFIKKKKIKVF